MSKKGSRKLLEKELGKKTDKKKKPEEQQPEIPIPPKKEVAKERIRKPRSFPPSTTMRDALLAAANREGVP